MKVDARLMRVFLGVAVAVAATVSALAAGERPNLKPGNWEITVNSVIEGVPPRPAVTMTKCIKPEDIKDTESFAAEMQKRHGNCTVSDMKRSGDKFSWSHSCGDGNSGTTEFTFHGDSYEGTTMATVPAKGQRSAMKMTISFKGKRTGDC